MLPAKQCLGLTSSYVSRQLLILNLTRVCIDLFAFHHHGFPPPLSSTTMVFITMVFHHHGLPPPWSSSPWSSTTMVFHHHGLHHHGLHHHSLPPPWSSIILVFMTALTTGFNSMPKTISDDCVCRPRNTLFVPV